MTGQQNRRDFLGTTAAGAAAAWTAPVFAIGQGRANEALRLGLIGCGGRGSYLMRSFQQLPDARIVAVCDVHAGRADKAREVAGGGPVIATGDFRRVLDNPDVDAVIVATAGHWHVLPTVQACQAGKDVYVEKPLGTSIGEGRAAVTAARKHDRIVQIGTQQRSWDHYAKAVELIQAGRLGEISEVKTWDYENDHPGFGTPPNGPPPPEIDWPFFVGPAPERPYNPNRFDHHYWFFDYGGGWPLDWAVHHYDIIHWAMGCDTPLQASASGGAFGLPSDNREWPDTFDGALVYPPCKVAPRGFLLQYSFRAACRAVERNHSKCFLGSDASMQLDRAGYQITGELRNGKKVTLDEQFRGQTEQQAVDSHLRAFIDNVHSRQRPFADVEVGHRSSNPGHLLNIAWRTGRTIHWDAASEQITNDPEASALLTRSYRAPWSLEVS